MGIVDVIDDGGLITYLLNQILGLVFSQVQTVQYYLFNDFPSPRPPSPPESKFPDRGSA